LKWIRTIAGEKAHAVFRAGDKKTACGIRLTNAARILAPPVIDRCDNCDRKWREVGARFRRALATKKRLIEAAEAYVYYPRFRFEDWESNADT